MRLNQFIFFVYFYFVLCLNVSIYGVISYVGDVVGDDGSVIKEGDIGKYSNDLVNVVKVLCDKYSSNDVVIVFCVLDLECIL